MNDKFEIGKKYLCIVKAHIFINAGDVIEITSFSNSDICYFDSKRLKHRCITLNIKREYFKEIF